MISFCEKRLTHRPPTQETRISSDMYEYLHFMVRCFFSTIVIKGVYTPCSWFYFFFMLESMEVTIRPRPNPASIDPTNANADAFKKKNPTPKPISKPPPIAHVLLSFFSFVLPIIEASPPICLISVQTLFVPHAAAVYLLKAVIMFSSDVQEFHRDRFALHLHTAQARHNQPDRNANPPSGVIAPNQLTPLILSV